MKKQHFTNIARLIVLALLVSPVMTWANDCQLANKLYNDSLNDSAQQSYLLNQAIGLCPNHVQALNNLASIRESENNLSSAQWLYNRAIEANPNFAPAYAGLGDVLMQRKDYQGAAVAFQNFLTVQEKNGDPEFQHYIPHYTKRLAEAQNKSVASYSEIYVALSSPRSSPFGPPQIDIQVKFATNSDEVTEQAWWQCKVMAKAIKAVFNTTGFENSLIRIDGHTDSRGDASYNKKLSIKRATKVKTVLVKDFNIPASRLKTVGWGEEKPKTTNSTVEGRSMNRRVTLIRLDD